MKLYDMIIDLYQRAGIKEYVHINYNDGYTMVAQRNGRYPIAVRIKDSKIESIQEWDLISSMEDTMMKTLEDMLFQNIEAEDKIAAAEICKVPQLLLYQDDKDETSENDSSDNSNIA